MSIMTQLSEESYEWECRAKKAEAEVERLRETAAYAYQLAGIARAGVEALDNLTAVSTGNLPPHPWPVASSELLEENDRLRAALVQIADTESTDGYLRDIRGGNAEIARAALERKP